jgi:hypothetical protein
MMWRRTFGGGVAVVAGAGILVLALTSLLFAQALGNGGSGYSQAATTTAENAVPGITNDSVPVSGAIAAYPIHPAPPSAAPPASTASISPQNFPQDAEIMKMPSSSGAAEVKPIIEALQFGTRAERRIYARASAAFPDFCEDWARKLRVREADNLHSLNFQEKSGYEVASYVGYSPIKSCECKDSPEGVPLGKVTYDEEEYFVEGKTIDEARRSPPKVVGVTHTLEIFNWDQNKWFY